MIEWYKCKDCKPPYKKVVMVHVTDARFSCIPIDFARLIHEDGIDLWEFTGCIISAFDYKKDYLKLHPNIDLWSHNIKYWAYPPDLPKGKAFKLNGRFH